MSDKIPGKCKKCPHLKKKERHYCNEEYWDNHLGMNGTPATDEIADNCKYNCVDHLCNIEVEYCNTQIRMAKLQKKNILQNSDELTQAYYHIRDTIKQSGYTHSAGDIIKYHADKEETGETNLPSSIYDIMGSCKYSIKKLYDAGYRG